MSQTKKNRTKRLRLKQNKTTSNRINEKVTVVFFEMLMMVKLFHWKTHSFATHKATDELYDSLNGNIDKFIEVLLGKTGTRIDLTKHKTIQIVDLNSQVKLKSKIESFKTFLTNMNDGTDLMNIRDEILGDLNKFLYLLTFK
jgi:DNA-binding ferritin-like protein